MLNVVFLKKVMLKYTQLALNQRCEWLSNRGQDFQVDTKAEIKWDYRGDIREYFNESKIV